MDTTKALIAAVRESATQIDERFEGYRAQLIRVLVHALEAQSIHGAAGPRRQAIENAIGMVADQVGNERLNGSTTS